MFHHLFWFITKSCAIVDLLTCAQVRTQRFKDSILLVFYYLFRHNSGILPLTHAPSIKFFFHFIYSCYSNKLHLYKYIYDIKVLLLQFERKKSILFFGMIIKSITRYSFSHIFQIIIFTAVVFIVVVFIA